MVYDSDWNMPHGFWRPKSSYPLPKVPPTGDPDGGALVCLPPINRDWLPFIQGCLDQLTQPTTWQVANDDAMYDILSRVNRLREMVGLSEACVSYQQRFTAECGLEYSIDGGETWIAVAGWLENFAHCFPPQTALRLNSNCNLQESFDGGATWPNVPGWSSNFRDCARDALPPPVPEPYPPTLPPASQACNIATYLAQKVIRGAMQQANDSIAATESLLTFGVALLALIPGIDLVAAGVLGGGAALFRYIEDGRTAAFTAAAADDSYWQRMACNIFACISDVGYITTDNWPCVLAAIPATSYGNEDVRFAVGQYAAKLGYYGAAITQQVGNLELGADCGSCLGPDDAWGFLYDTSGTYGDFHAWSVTAPTVVGANGIQSGLSAGDQILIAQITFPLSNIDGWQLTYHRTYDYFGGSSEIAYHHSGSWHDIPASGSPGDTVAEQDVLTTCDGLALELDTSQHGQAGDTYVNRVWIWGHGTCPFGTPNYHYPP